MPAFGKPRVVGRILVMIVIIIALTLGGLVWFDYLGLLHLKDTFAPVYKLMGIPSRRPTSLPADSDTLLEDERTAKLYEALDAAREDLSARSGTLDEREAEIAKTSQELEEQRKDLEDKEKSFNQTVESIENRKANVDQNARYLTGMQPQKAVEILKSMDDQMIIDVLRAVEAQAKAAGTDSVVAYWLSLMPPERSAAIQRKMTSKPETLD